jgi:hypothetical protein
LRSVTDIEGLKNARMEFAALFPLGLGTQKVFLFIELWLEWIEDEKNLIASVEDKNGLIQLYLRATLDYQRIIWDLNVDIHIWISLFEYIQQEYDEGENWMSLEEFRHLALQALSSVGYHFMSSHLVWEIIKDVELGFLQVRDQFYSLCRNLNPRINWNTLGNYTSTD